MTLDIPGHERAATLLRRDLEGGHVAHAYLFAGAAPRRGALTFASACVGTCGGCGRCATCVQVSRLAHPDVELIEPAGMQLLVDQVREVIRSAWRVPVAGPRRVVVVDQADRMNPNAQNAFLKALEEPPASTVIVLLAPSPEALLETVRSRCREVLFQPLTEADVAADLVAAGLPPGEAGTWARVGGSLERARRLALDQDARERRRGVAERVLQPARDPGDALQAAEWLAGQTRAIREEVAAAHKSNAAEFAEWFRETKKAAEDRLRREQRRAEQDALETALDDVTSVLRDVLLAVEDAEAPLLNEDLRPGVVRRAAGLRAEQVLVCLAAVDEARRRLRSNANVLLALERVFLELYERLGESRAATG